MKTTVLGIALALATMSLTFAAQTTPPAAPNSTTAPKAKTHSKKSHKKPVKKATESVKPAAAVK